ncbi:MAG: helix-turn-helix domain-containing protein [Reichenbachiella sp.]|uniref:helix-turn-helix domain-containing protein n=1 Tax=Reichenbachiella sp. TaxID=2184521 RepID=UPI003298C358
MILIHDVSILLNAIFFGLSLFLAVLLWNQRTSYRLSNRMLSVLLVAIAITTFNTIIRLSYYMDAMDFYQHISNVALLVMGPSIYLFVKIRISDPNDRKWIIHFVPFFIYALLLTMHAIMSFQHAIEVINNLAFLTFVIQWVIYIILTFYLVNTYQNQTKQTFSNLEKRDLGWIKVILSLLLATLIMRLTLLVHSIVAEKVLDVVSLNLTLIFAMITCYLGYKIFKNPALFVKLTSYSQSKLSTKDLQFYIEKIESVMTDQALFANPKLTITELADQADLHSRVVSQTLNQEANQNFFDYVNGYRVKDLIERLKSPNANNYTLQALMEESGFQSPSVAYSAFKKVTGTTPAKFRKTNL